MAKWLRYILMGAVILGFMGYTYWKYVIPKHRITVESELIMLGDLDGDHRWTNKDISLFYTFINNPYSLDNAATLRLDLNQNGYIDEQDINIIRQLVAANGNPYASLEVAQARSETFPRPRELYRYVPVAQYHLRPLWALPYAGVQNSVLDWLKDFKPNTNDSYADKLDSEIYAEAVRFDNAWKKRQSTLTDIEKDYARIKLLNAKRLYDSGDRYELLLSLIELTEDAETLTSRNQPDFPLKLLVFRDHLRDLLESPLYAEFEIGNKEWTDVLRQVSVYSKEDLGMEYDFSNMKPARNLSDLQNYLQRAEWQYYKTSAKDGDFRALIDYAQHDPRYLRAVARTSRKLQDLRVNNHNLPMVLLFREALRLKGGDKKKAVGLLDEAIRIPYGWIKFIPNDMLPSSLALDNFLLPGNKEDGADKSRHWNVFGGICLYKSPQEAVDLALRREFQDLKKGGYTNENMREFIRDMVANINGMYHVMTINPNLLTSAEK
ncbi:hypothetical protein Emin_0759 [Elusimicrobium minutum Pei191]|uniref:Dockerin domain-containing protein n=1 Tax=Elusimicrobium minutum (strain Pei191) TaxID=445932 RepID=B2KCR8_ELUMP|nr:hypothetical protein [Elusimicrobium minutum]ACC98314.1 hypothetical protein Emin_0759 [Elusimicrobium minutum Pei191]